MELINISILYMLLIILVLISVAFITLTEQKVLGGVQIRVGPNKVGYWGILQPFADAVKLFSKENMNLVMGNSLFYYISPILSLLASLLLWVNLPFFMGSISIKFIIFMFMCISSVGVYPILMSGWASNCKYSLLGSLRAVAQMVSYEISLMMIILSLILVFESFELIKFSTGQDMNMGLFIFLPLSLIWFASMLAETNRTPYDFAEGESELVSGFNTEYSAGGFTLIFMAEYSSLLFMSMLYSVFFLGSIMNGNFLMMKTVIVMIWMIWVRGTLPRFRYDKLMYLAWQSFLPLSLLFFMYYLMI